MGQFLAGLFVLVVVALLVGGPFAAIAYGIFGSDRMAWLFFGIGALLAMAGLGEHFSKKEEAKKQQNHPWGCNHENN